MDWDKLKSFYRVAKLGNISRAAEAMNISQSALSRQIMSLEERLGIRLFERHARHLTLTHHGNILLNYTEQIRQAAETAENLIREDSSEATGHLRVIATVGMTALYITPYLPEFLKKHPNIKLSILATDVEPKLNFKEADIAIRPYIHKDSTLIQKPLITTHSSLYASPNYLKKFGTPTKAADLDTHKLIAFGDHDHHPFDEMDWHLRIDAPQGHVREPIIKVNIAEVRARLAESGLGIATLSREHPGLEDMDLVEVLPDLGGAEITAYFIHPRELQSSKRIESFYTHLHDKLNAGTKKNR